jgi:multidrug efflux pump subunit AcrA (membrane-fusion protein)
MSKRRWYSILLVVAGLAIPVLLWATVARPIAREVPTPLRTLSVTTVTPRQVSSYDTQREYTGTVQAARVSNVAFQRSGKVVEVLVDQGDRVETGQPLARLDTRHLVAERRRMEAELREATARLDELVAGPRAEVIAAAEAEVRNLTAQERLQALNAERRKFLLEGQAIAQEEYDGARLGLESVTARLDAARERLRELRAGTRPERIAAARAAVEQLRASLQSLDHDLEDCELAAPFAGTVADRFVDEGVVITTQTPVVRLVEGTRLEAWFGLPPAVAREISEGEVVALRVGQAEVAGTLRAVLPELDVATRTRRVVVSLNEPASLVTGELVRLTAPERIETTGFWLPVSALTSGSRGLWSCFAVVPESDGVLRVERRDVEVLHTSGERVLVRGTLQTGEPVVTAGTHRIAHGQVVTIAPSSTKAAVADAMSTGGSGRG